MSCHDHGLKGNKRLTIIVSVAQYLDDFVSAATVTTSILPLSGAPLPSALTNNQRRLSCFILQSFRFYSCFYLLLLLAYYSYYK
ncbi:hypothetical protein BDW74DRAFT_26484 [Aspergillus multicolor]|uniref:uncharacterized protein n=1 Tax=Aspergillus multicolor TaxID=41759 RepID=UPI003CCCE988